MIEKIDHLGIAVQSLAEASELYRQLGFVHEGEETVPEQQVRVSFFKAGESHIELLEPTAPDSPIGRFLEKRGPGIHHLCVEVDDIDAALANYREQGIRLINPEPVVGAGGCRVAFVHPKSTYGVLIELKERS